MPERAFHVYRITAAELAKIKQEPYPDVDIKIDDPYNLVYHREEFYSPISELTQNCIDQGATQVRVKVGQRKMVVEDNIHHSDAKKLAERLNRDRVKTTKPTDPEWGFAWGGIGILSCRRIFAKLGGKLNYYPTEDNRVIAVATWLR